MKLRVAPKKGANKILVPLVAVTGAVLLFVLVFLAARHFLTKKPVETSRGATASQIEQTRAPKVKSNLLQTQDYDSYQAFNNTLAAQYIGYKDYANAERVLNESLQKVPKDKINDTTYMQFIKLGIASKNVEMQKKYLNLTIAYLKNHNRSSEAQEYQNYLENLK